MGGGTPNWTTREDDFLRANVDRPNAWIAEQLGNRTWQGVKRRRGRLKLRQTHHFWTPEQDQKLLNCTPMMGNHGGKPTDLQKLAVELGRTYGACAARRPRLRRDQRPAGARGF